MSAMKVGELEEGATRETHWYVFLHESGRANEIVAKALNTEPDNPERFRQDVVCADERKRNLIAVSFAESRVARIAGAENSFKVTVYVVEGGGMPRVWKDPAVARRRRILMKKVKTART